MFALYNHQVAFLDRRSFCKIGAENQHFIRLSAAASAPLLQEGVNRLQAALEDKVGFLKFMKNQAHLF